MGIDNSITLSQAVSAHIARMDELTGPETMQARIEESIAAISAVLLAGNPAAISSSWGKDSSVLCALVLEAARRLKAAGRALPPIAIVSSDTGIENSEIVYLRSVMFAHVEAYAQVHGLPVECKTTRPRMSESYLVRIIGGRKLPSYVDGNGDCSTDMKVSPITRYAKALDAKFKSRGLPPVVSMIGTRFSESAKRGTAMRERGESATEVQRMKVGSSERLILSPIAQWETEQIFCFLQNVGQGRGYPAFAPDFSETLRIYNDSAGAGCIVDPGMSAQKRSKGCGARTGCSLCTRVTNDRSMDALLMLPEYEYMRGLARLRNYLMAIRWDLGRRNWIGRVVDAATGNVRIFPNTFSAVECERLLRMVLTLDQRERRRAAGVARDLSCGRLPRTAYNERMSRPQFENLSAREILAIDYLWSAGVWFPPFHAWRVWKDVVENGNELDVPVIEPVAKPAEMPPEAIIPGDLHMYLQLAGVVDTALEMAGGDVCGDLVRDEAAWDVDEEGTSMFLDFELEDCLRAHAGSTARNAQAAARYYLRLGVVAYPRSRVHLLDRFLRQGEYLIHLGLSGIDMPPASLVRLVSAAPATEAVALKEDAQMALVF